MGLDEKSIDDRLSIETKDIILTQRAQSELVKLIRDQSIPDNYFLRMSVQGGGCSGFQYSLAFDDFLTENDTIYEFENPDKKIKVAVDYKSMIYLKGTTLDYLDGLNGRGFTFNNPNAVRTCGCGSSFSG